MDFDYSSLYDLEDLLDYFFGWINTLDRAYIAVLTIAAIISALISLCVAVAMYLLRSIPLYQLAKEAGRPHPWLAFIPIGYVYTLGDLAPDRPFTLFGKKIQLKARSTAFWGYLIARFGGGIISAVLTAMSAIPVVGFVFGIVDALLELILEFAMGAIFWRYLKDALDVYRPNEKNNMLFSILGTIFNGIGFIIILWIIRKNRPVYQTQD